MGDRKFFDFDAFWEAQDRTPVTIRVFGVAHILPPSLPAKLVLYRERLLAELGETGSLDSRDVEKMARILFGDQRVDGWLDRDDFGIEQLYDLFRQTMRMYATAEAGDAEGEAGAPETGTTQTQSPTSSSTGDSSKPTSNGSTDSISATP